MQGVLTLICVVLVTTLLNFGWFRFYLGINPYQQAIQPTTGTEIKINQVHYSLDQFQQSLVDSIEKSKDSVVNIVVTKDFAYYYNNNPFSFFEDFFGNGNTGWWQVVTGSKEIGWWSGIFVATDDGSSSVSEWNSNKNGYILTNKHVVHDPEAKYTVIFANGKTATVEQVWLDPKIDIAVIKIKNPDWFTPQSALAVSIDDEVKVGQFAIAVGNSLAQYKNSVTFGIISGRNRQLWTENGNVYAWLYQTDAAISQGNSGGPLFDINGRVMGINTAVSAVGSNIGFAIPVTQEFINATLQSIEKYGKISRPFLWIQYLDLNPNLAKELFLTYEQGILVQDVIPNSPAAQAWLQSGDIITSVNEKLIDDSYPFLYQLYTHDAGDILSLTVVSNGVERKLQIKISD